MRSILATAVIASLGQAIDVVTINAPTTTTIDYDWLYAEYVAKYGLRSKTQEEFDARMAQFIEIDTDIRTHNAQEGITYTMAHNKFSDWSVEEKATLTGNKRMETQDLLGNYPGDLAEFNTTAIPLELNWKHLNHTTPIQDQGQCGSCWAFMAAGTVESAWSIFGGDLFNISEQELVDCATQQQGAYGCEGAYLDAGYNYYMNGTKPATEADYPYNATQSHCVANYTASTPIEVTSWNSITSKDGLQIKGALNQGPVGVSIAANCTDFYQYAGGIFNAQDCPNQMSDLDHAVQLIGYGMNNATQEYFILKNSWGNGWGMDGYMHIAYNSTGTGVIGVNLEPVIPITSNSQLTSGVFEAVSGLTTFAVATLALFFSF